MLKRQSASNNLKGASSMRNTSNSNEKNNQKSGADNNMGSLGPSGMLSARSRLLNNMVAETVSDRHKISLIEDLSPRIQHDEDNCRDEKCPANYSGEVNKVAYSASNASLDEIDQRSDRVLHDTETDNESYDSEELHEKGAADAMALRASGGLILQDRDSMVNMGENLTKDNIRELRKMKREIVEPNLGTQTNKIKASQLLPKVEESKVETQVA